MRQILVVGEDPLCCALGERLVQAYMPGWSLSQQPINTRGVTQLCAALPRYARQARFVQPVLCIADTDGQCAVQLVTEWLGDDVSEKLLLRLAVTEAESWVLADAQAFAAALCVPQSKVPRYPDQTADPKAAVLKLARRSGDRRIRQEMVSASDPLKTGSGYNLHMCRFVGAHWRATVAAASSPSLQRAIGRLATLASAG